MNTSNYSGKDIILFGIQGSGKGTQAKILAEKYDMKIFETGGELRGVSEEDSELGQEVKAIISRGDLVSNEIVMRIVEHFLEGVSSNDRVIFDGIPRSMPQKESLDALLTEHERDFFGLFLEVPKEEVVSRMKDRGRHDDTDEAITRRIENYETETIPVIDKYEAEGKMIRVNGFQSIVDVARDVQQDIRFAESDTRR